MKRRRWQEGTLHLSDSCCKKIIIAFFMQMVQLQCVASREICILQIKEFSLVHFCCFFHDNKGIKCASQARSLVLLLFAFSVGSHRHDQQTALQQLWQLCSPSASRNSCWLNGTVPQHIGTLGPGIMVTQLSPNEAFCFWISLGISFFRHPSLVFSHIRLFDKQTKPSFDGPGCEVPCVSFVAFLDASTI